jgi:TetR/AcrR family transcriptional repressor of mexJK operon
MNMTTGTRVSDRQRAGTSGIEGRSARKHREILEAATELFLKDGYHATSLDDVAGLASVSKQTIYNHFPDKESLFRTVVLSVGEISSGFIERAVIPLAVNGDPEAGLRKFASDYIATVMQPRVLELRRLVIAESGRFPDLARAYYDLVPEPVLKALASLIATWQHLGLLQEADTRLAAAHLAWLILWPVDKAMFLGAKHGFADQELARVADAGVEAFVAAYRRR